MFAWAGKTLLVDLTSGQITKEPLSEALRRDFIGGRGINVKVLWLIPVAGIAAIASAKKTGPGAKKIALVSGIAVFGSMLWMIGSVANLFFAWGAWTTLGASATALALGVLAPTASASETR